MPFQSEAQRRYLWANEPEIARDWTDTYGSKIQAADGGIMRLGYLHGGVTHPDGRRGFFEGAQREAEAGLGAMSPGTGMTGGGRGLGDARGDAIKNYAVNPNFSTIGAPPSFEDRSTRPTHTPQTKGFFGNLGRDIKDYIMSGGMWGAGLRGIQSLFSPKQPTKTEMYAAMEDAPFNQQKKMYDWGPTGGGDGQQQQYPPWWYDNAYAQNIVDDEELDIDTSTGDMEEWIQRFRVKDPYRQDQGALDEQIREYVSKLYT
jgi:hypothetical protein